MIYTVNNNGFVAEFVFLEDAQNYAAENGNLSILEINPTYEEQYHKDIAFGKMLIDNFLIDNRNLCNSGVIKTARAMLANIKVDSDIDAEGNPIAGAIFTQSRKDDYLQMIDEYLTN